MVEESARRKISRGTWEARHGIYTERYERRSWGNNNLGSDRGRESEWPIVARKSLKGDGAKGPYFSHVLIKEGGYRLSQECSVTEWMAEGFQPEPGMPVKVSLLRWKLGRKAKREQLLVNALQREAVGEPDAGNPHVRFDEGEGSISAWTADYLPRRLKGPILRKLAP